MPTVVGVRFKYAGKIYYFDPVDYNLSVNDDVIVETARGMEYGVVVTGREEVSADDIVQPLKQVVRPATERDREQVAKNKELEAKAMEICLRKIKEHGLPMRLVDVEYTFDHSKIIFFFTADGRVDFRELVKDLASVFRTRIELRQIGVRDEAKMLGGLGPCGRVLCCRSWLSDFSPVSIKMAKDQNLSLNPSKISGQCGRLICCLRYECDAYEEAREELPDIGRIVDTTEGQGKVVGTNILKKTVQVELEETGRIMEFPSEEIDIKDEVGEPE